MRNLHTYVSFSVVVIFSFLVFSIPTKAQWQTDLSDNVKTASIRSGSTHLFVTCERFTNHETIQIHVPRRTDLLVDNVGDTFIGMSWNGNQSNFDMPIGSVNNTSGLQIVILKGGPLSGSISQLIRKLKQYSSVELLLTDSNQIQSRRTLSLRGSSNAINRVQRACR